MQLTTVKIKHGEGYAVINERDYKPSEHELFEQPAMQVVEDLTTQLPALPVSQIVESLATQIVESPARHPEPKKIKRLTRRKTTTP